MLNFYRLEQDIIEQMQTAHVPGLALAIVRGPEVIYARGFGVTSVEDGGLPVTPQTLFRVGSTAKPLTGTAIMRLVEAGRLDLDQPVSTYVPWLTFSQEGAIERVTLRLLMTHRAGLPSAAEPFGWRDPDGLERFVRERIPCYPLIAPPGKVYSYSNPGIDLAGYIAQVVGGKPFAELMQELVFDPLEMRRTTFDPTVAMTYPLAQAHDLRRDGTLSVQHRFAENSADYPAGFALSTALDLANFAIMHMQQGRFHGRQLLAPALIAEMHRPQVDLYTVTGTGYGLTFITDTYKGQREVRHGGGISSFVSSLTMLPDAGIAVIILCNRFGIMLASIIHRIFDQLLDLPKVFPRPPVIEPDRSLWPRYTGSYLGPWTGLATISVANDHLILDLQGQAIPLQALRQDLYCGQKGEDEETISVGFIAEEHGPVQYISVDTAICKRIERDPAFAPDPASWIAYTGTYAKAGLDTYIVRLEGDRLYIYSEVDDKEVILVPVDTTRFVCEWGLFEFHMSGGRVTALTQAGTWTFIRAG